MHRLDTAEQIIAEMRDFAAFDAAEQRYIRRSLDIAFGRHDPYERYARNAREKVSIRRQVMVYSDVPQLRLAIPKQVDDKVDLFFGQLVRLTVCDLCEGCLASFHAYRFLYERIFGPAIRPWLAAAFCAVAAMPSLPTERRSRLLHSIREAEATASSWSARPAQFLPSFVTDPVGG